jgi:Leucine-rich repeat (LRR) protein
MRPSLAIGALCLLSALPGDALSGDLNRDGVVDFDDFFLFGDQFGQSGDPDVSDTVVVVRTDTLQVVVRDTIAVIDTLYIDPADTVSRHGTPITFADPAVEFAVRDRVGLPEGELLTGDVENLTTLNLAGRSVSLLDGLEHLVALRTLSLANNLVVDVTPLAQLSSLRSLSLADNDVRDISPLVDNGSLGSGSSVVLAGNPLSVASRTTHVRSLQDRGVTVTADAFVVTFADSLLEQAVRTALMVADTVSLLHLDLETITTLDVASDSVADLSGLEYLRGLTELDLRDNAFTSISPLSSLKQLQVLDLSDNAVGSFTPLAGATALRDLRLTNTGMTSVSPLSGLTSLEVLYLNQNNLDSIAGLANLTGLRQLNLRSNQLTDISVMLGLTGLTDAWLESNPLDDNANDVVIPALVDQGTFVRF